MATIDGKPIPLKLRNDAIVEALLEIRFSTQTIPEILFGRLAELAPWKNFVQTQMPAYNLPAALRQADPNLRYQPVFALVDEGGRRAVRIGPQVLSYHRTMPYVGWTRFKAELEEAIAGIFEKAEDLSVERLGLRYLNALRSDIHGVHAISDLDLRLEIAGRPVQGNTNVNFTTDLANNTACTVRIATPEFIMGNLPANTYVYVDVDVFTKEKFATKKQMIVKDWVEAAHTQEKQQFFRLLTTPMIKSLKEE